MFSYEALFQSCLTSLVIGFAIPIYDLTVYKYQLPLLYLQIKDLLVKTDKLTLYIYVHGISQCST